MPGSKGRHLFEIALTGGSPATVKRISGITTYAALQQAPSSYGVTSALIFWGWVKALTHCRGIAIATIEPKPQRVPLRISQVIRSITQIILRTEMKNSKLILQVPYTIIIVAKHPAQRRCSFDCATCRYLCP